MHGLPSLTMSFQMHGLQLVDLEIHACPASQILEATVYSETASVPRPQKRYMPVIGKATLWNCFYP